MLLPDDLIIIPQQGENVKRFLKYFFDKRSINSESNLCKMTIDRGGGAVGHGPCAGGLWCDAEGIAETPLAARRHVVVAGNGGGVVACVTGGVERP